MSARRGPREASLDGSGPRTAAGKEQTRSKWGDRGLGPRYGRGPWPVGRSRSCTGRTVGIGFPVFLFLGPPPPVRSWDRVKRGSPESLVTVTTTGPSHFTLGSFPPVDGRGSTSHLPTVTAFGLSSLR